MSGLPKEVRVQLLALSSAETLSVEDMVVRARAILASCRGEQGRSTCAVGKVGELVARVGSVQGVGRMAIGCGNAL